MSIHYALLGILSVRPLTGYDIKKLLQDSAFMHWSGNNNQVYKALVELHGAGQVALEVVQQEGAPAKKVYSITDAGLAELKNSGLAAPDVPETRKPFLVQLAFAGQLSTAQLLDLLCRYERDMAGQLMQAQKSAASFLPPRTEREAALWQLIHDNVTDEYQAELQWIAKVQKALAGFPDEPQEPEQMQHTLIEKDGAAYLYLGADGAKINTEQDGIDLMGLCMQYGVNRILIHQNRLSEDFYRLRTGLAGAILQKFSNYNIRAAVLGVKEPSGSKYGDFIAESNRGGTFRAYDSQEAAEKWLLA